jgi:Concanavalin A-like lectin/glucanases superfamily
MKPKHVKSILAGGIVTVIILVVALLITSPSSAASGSPFLGSWYGTDGDGSDIRLDIAGSPNGPFHITSTDSYITFCNGDAGIIRGTGSLNPENSTVLDVHLKVDCFTTGDTVEFDTSFLYIPAADTLSGISVTWHRANARPPKCVAPPMGLTDWWPGDGNTENIVSWRNGSFMGDATTGPGLVDDAFVFDGDGDYIDVPDDPGLNFGTADFTVDLWVNFNTLSGEQVLIEKWIQEDAEEHPFSQGWTLTKIDNNVYFVMDDGSVGDYLVGSALEIKPHTWYQIAITRQGSTFTLYWNGMAVISADYDSLNLDAPISLKFGRREGFQGLYLNGRIDEVELYNGTALTPDQINGLYSAGKYGKCKGSFISPCVAPVEGMTSWWPGDGNSDDIVAGRNASFLGDATTGPGLVGEAFVLDGDGDYIEAPEALVFNFGTRNFTVDLWVNFNDLTGEQVLMEKWIQHDPNSQGWTLTKLPGQVIRLAWGNGNGSGNSIDSNMLDLQPNTWYLFSATRNGRLITLYMNGTAIASGEYATLDLNSTSSLKFGHRGNPTDTPGSDDDRGFYLNGRIDEVEIYNGTALTQEQILDIYTAGSAGKCKGNSNIPLPTIRAHPAWDNVDGWFWPVDRILLLTIDDPSTPKNPDIKMKKSGADRFMGSVWFNLAGFVLKPGDIITMSDGVFSKTLTVSSLTITSVDFASGMVYGTADPSMSVSLSYPCYLQATFVGDGNWYADFRSAGCTLQPGSMLIGEQYDGDGDLTSFEYEIP